MPVPTPRRAILIHGNGGCTAADGWLPFVERDLRALGLAVVNETFAKRYLAARSELGSTVKVPGLAEAPLKLTVRREDETIVLTEVRVPTPAAD